MPDPTPPSPPLSLVEAHGTALFEVAAASIRHGLEHGEALTVDTDRYPNPMRAPGASFVTLYHGEALRGCIGTSNAYQPLVADVAANAFAAAFSDPRFQCLRRRELSALLINLSVLSDPRPVLFEDEASLLEQLRPGTDGVILDIDGNRALFLPQVWSTLPDPTSFLRQLKRKAGYPASFWSATITAWTFQVGSVSSDATMVRGGSGI